MSFARGRDGGDTTAAAAELARDDGQGADGCADARIDPGGGYAGPRASPAGGGPAEGGRAAGGAGGTGRAKLMLVGRPCCVKNAWWSVKRKGVRGMEEGCANGSLDSSHGQSCGRPEAPRMWCVCMCAVHVCMCMCVCVCAPPPALRLHRSACPSTVNPSQPRATNQDMKRKAVTYRSQRIRPPEPRPPAPRTGTPSRPPPPAAGCPAPPHPPTRSSSQGS